MNGTMLCTAYRRCLFQNKSLHLHFSVFTFTVALFAAILIQGNTMAKDLKETQVSQHEL